MPERERAADCRPPVACFTAWITVSPMPLMAVITPDMSVAWGTIWATVSLIFLRAVITPERSGAAMPDGADPPWATNSATESATRVWPASNASSWPESAPTAEVRASIAAPLVSGAGGAAASGAAASGAAASGAAASGAGAGVGRTAAALRGAARRGVRAFFGAGWSAAEGAGVSSAGVGGAAALVARARAGAFLAGALALAALPVGLMSVTVVIPPYRMTFAIVVGAIVAGATGPMPCGGPRGDCCRAARKRVTSPGGAMNIW